MQTRYAELHCRSNYSFLTGASHPAELVEQAGLLGYAALAITDECSLAGVVRAFEAAERIKLPLLIGSEMQLTLPTAGVGIEASPDAARHARLVLIAQTRAGYGNLSRWITLARRRAGKGRYRAHPGDVEGKSPEAPKLAGLPGCLALLVPDASQSFETVFAHALWLKTWFQDRASIAIELHRRAHDDELVDVVCSVAQLTGLPIVAAGDVLMHVRSRKPLQDVLSATRLKTPVAECGRRLQPNAEQYLRPRIRLSQLYEPEWLDNTLVLAGRCAFSLAELKYEYPQEIVPAGATPDSHLRQLTEAGLVWRFPQGISPDLRATVEKELGLIATLDYARYFLTVADIVAWARGKKILCQGRGSAANSVVCYCLGVTAVDPSKGSLLFERFISVERNEPPDIDIDFEHQRREEVIQYIYDKYGRHRAALTAVVICYRPRSALRDVGRALGIDMQRIEAVAKTQHWFDGRRIDPDRLREGGFDPESPIVRLWTELTQQLIGFPRHLSQHPGGFVIAAEEMSELVPVENAAMKDRSVIQWDKDDLDVLRLLKVDILALGMLSALRRSLQLMEAKLQRPVELTDIPQGDPATYDMICQADTVGVFQIESRAQMSMLPRLKPRCYYDLVVEVAIVRPGPIQGGMVHPFLTNRDRTLEEIGIRPELRPALERTRGVPIFQEQVMQIAMLAADFTAGEADQLRRAMAAWKRKGGLEPFEQKLIGRMVAKGYELEYAERIFKQIKGFGEYGFPESHAASFALLVYISSWVKRHHPDVFLAGLLNSQPMGFYAPAQLVRDAREHGVEVLPVDVRCSQWETGFDVAPPPVADGRVLGGHALLPIRLGLGRISGLSEASGQRIVDARRAVAFVNIEDLARRADLDAHALKALAEADALRGLAGNRHQAAWGVAGIDTRPTAMLRETRVSEDAIALAAPSEAENMQADYRALGLSLNSHPLALLRTQLDAFKIQTAATLRRYPAGRIARASGLVTHRQRPETAKGTVFVTIEDETGAVNIIVWPTIAQTQRQPLLGARLLTVYGQWQREGDVMHLLASKLVDHTPLLEGLITRSRDFR